MIPQEVLILRERSGLSVCLRIELVIDLVNNDAGRVKDREGTV